MLKEPKDTMNKELKGNSQKIDNVSKELENIKRNQIEILELKSTTRKLMHRDDPSGRRQSQNLNLRRVHGLLILST